MLCLYEVLGLILRIKKRKKLTLAGVAQWIERWLLNQKDAGSIPSQGTCLGCKPGPQEGACERQPHIDVSLPLSPSLPLSLRVNK